MPPLETNRQERGQRYAFPTCARRFRFSTGRTLSPAFEERFEPTALAATNPFTGGKSPLGVAFYWSAEGRTVHIELESPLTVPRPGGAFEAKRWDLTLPAEREGAEFAIRESFPEQDYELPVQYEWEILVGSYLG